MLRWAGLIMTFALFGAPAIASTDRLDVAIAAYCHQSGSGIAVAGKKPSIVFSAMLLHDLRMAIAPR